MYPLEKILVDSFVDIQERAERKVAGYAEAWSELQNSLKDHDYRISNAEALRILGHWGIISDAQVKQTIRAVCTK